MKALIENILRLITKRAAVRSAIPLLLAIGLLNLLASHESLAQEPSPSSLFSSPAPMGSGGKADPEFLAKKSAIFKQFHIREAKPDEYPIKILPADKVLPVIHDVVSAGTIAWLDNETIIYVAQTGLTANEVRTQQDSLRLVSLNLDTLDTKDIIKLNTPRFCYDYETNNFVSASFVEPLEPSVGIGHRVYIHGKLGGDLKTDILPPLPKTERRKAPWTNHLDCTFYPVLGEPGTIGRTVIRTADGYLGKESANGKDVAGGYLPFNWSRHRAPLATPKATPLWRDAAQALAILSPPRRVARSRREAPTS